MSEILFSIFGVGGCGRSIMPQARRQLTDAKTPKASLVFIDDDEAYSGQVINGHNVLSYENFLSKSASEKYVAIAVANGTTRKEIALRCENDGVRPWSLFSENVVQMDNVEIGVGAILSPFVTLTSNITIGNHFHANLYSYVEHDCVVGNYVTFGPGVKCNGNVHIGDYAYIGSGAVIKQGAPHKPLRIGEGAVIGMGAVVTKDVPPGETVIGNPARISKGV